MREEKSVSKFKSSKLVPYDASVGLAYKAPRDGFLKESSRKSINVVEEPVIVLAEEKKVVEVDVVGVQRFPAHLK